MPQRLRRRSHTACYSDVKHQLARLPEIASSFKVRDLLPQLLGLWLALLLNRHFKGKAITRAFILLPFIIPTRLFC